jgi:hypothetical protein
LFVVRRRSEETLVLTHGPLSVPSRDDVLRVCLDSPVLATAFQAMQTALATCAAVRRRAGRKPSGGTHTEADELAAMRAFVCVAAAPERRVRARLPLGQGASAALCVCHSDRTRQ